MKTKEEYLKAVDELLTEYDAYYFLNKYGDLDKNTHGKQFEMLLKLLKDDDMSMRALNWIKNAYDCFYKVQVIEDDDNAFYYLINTIEKKLGDSNES